MGCGAGSRVQAWLRASLNQQALGARLLALYGCRPLLERHYSTWVPSAKRLDRLLSLPFSATGFGNQRTVRLSKTQ